MDREGIEYRAGFVILLAARAHLMASEYEQESDDLLGQASIRVQNALRLTARPGDHSVYWTTRPGPRLESPTAEFRATVVAPDGKKYKLIHDCTENV